MIATPLQLIRDQLSPAFFRLVSNILVADHSERVSLTVADRNAYAQEVVECWTRLLTIMIENDVAVSSGLVTRSAQLTD